MTKPVSDLDVGRAAEHLVVADLILSGRQAYLTEQGLPYDIVLDEGGALYRVQVKATQRIARDRGTGSVYWFNIRCGKQEGGGRRGYRAEFEILALVALDIRVIAYLPTRDCVPQTIRLHPPGYTESLAAMRCGWGNSRRARAINQFPVETAIAALAGTRPVLSPAPRIVPFPRPQQASLFSMETTA